MARYIFVVARRQAELYEYLRERFAEDADVLVILDRRREQRRQGSLAVSHSERRLTDRRQRPEVDDELRIASHAVVTLGDVDSPQI